MELNSPSLQQLKEAASQYEVSSLGEYLWEIRGKFKGPMVTMLGAVHGDEAIGVQLILEVMKLANCVRAGILQLGIGNPEAYQADPKVRFIEKDLNRCFGNNTGVKYEERRAAELKPALRRTEILFDIHSTIKPSKSFLTAPNPHHAHGDIIVALGIPTVITGEGLLPPDKDPIYTDTFVTAHGGLGVTVEAGWQKDPETKKIIPRILNALRTLGVLDIAVQEKSATIVPEYWDAYWNVIAGKNFSFTQDWRNFQTLEAGTHFATSDGTPLLAPERSIILFPKPPEKIVPSQEACIIAKYIIR